MKSRNYWTARFKALENRQNQTAAQTYAQIEPAFDKAQAQIQKEIEHWYQRIADNNEISLADAQKLLSKNELKEFHWSVEDYIKYGKENSMDPKWMKELENASAKFHISRLEALKINTQQQLEVAFGNQLDGIDQMARNVYQDEYYRTAFEIMKGNEVGFNIGTIDTKKLDQVIKKPWVADGSNFSDRIWANKNQMVNALHQEMTRTFIIGGKPDDAIAAMTAFLADKTTNAKRKAARLVQTEQAYFSSAAQKDCFKDLGVEEFEIVASLDAYTCEICGAMDGKHASMDVFQEGVTAPPFHPFCRCTTVPYFNDEWSAGERAARGEDGKTYYVPADTTYSRWKKGFVDANPADIGMTVVNNDRKDELMKQFNEKTAQIESINQDIMDNQSDMKLLKDGKRKYASFIQMEQNGSDIDEYVNSMIQRMNDAEDQISKIHADTNLSEIEKRRNIMPYQTEKLQSEYAAKSAKEYKDWKNTVGKYNETHYVKILDDLNMNKSNLIADKKAIGNQLIDIIKTDKSYPDTYVGTVSRYKDIFKIRGYSTDEELHIVGKLTAQHAKSTEWMSKLNDLVDQKDRVEKKYRDLKQQWNSWESMNPTEAKKFTRLQTYLVYADKPDSRFYKDYLDALNDAESAPDKVKDLFERLKGAEYKKNSISREIAKLKTQNSYASNLKDALSEVREMGSTGLDVKKHLGNSKSSVVKYIEDAYDCYPKEWVSKSVNHNVLTVRKVKRGRYTGTEILIDDHEFETAVHELGHRFEEVIDGIKKSESEFYARRTSGEPLEWLGVGYRKDEKTRKDKFLHKYMGKDYGGNAYELVSMGFQYAYIEPYTLAKDPDMEEWIYGLLTLY